MTKARENSDYTGLQGDLAGLQTNITAGDTAARAGRKNWIINGDMQISQRGDYTSATSATDGLFYLDRWKAQVTNVTATIQDTTLSQKLVATSTASGNLEVLQKVEDFNILTNKTITVSAKITSNSSAARIAVLTASGTWHSSSAHTGGGNEETLSVTFSSGSATRMDVWIGITGSSRAAVSISSGNYVEITGVQLELGSVATDFEHRSYGEELRLCQRYFYRYKGATQERIYNENAGATGKWWFLTFPEMRTTPSATFSSGWTGGSIVVIGGTINSMSVGGGSSTAMSFRVTNSGSGGTVKALYHTDSFSQDYCYLSAEL